MSPPERLTLAEDRLERSPPLAPLETPVARSPSHRRAGGNPQATQLGGAAPRRRQASRSPQAAQLAATPGDLGEFALTQYTGAGARQRAQRFELRAREATEDTGGAPGDDFDVDDAALKAIFGPRALRAARKYYRSSKLLEAQGGPLSPEMMKDLGERLGVASSSFDTVMLRGIARYQYQRGLPDAQIDARLRPTPDDPTWQALAIDCPSFRPALLDASPPDAQWTPEQLERMVSAGGGERVEAALVYNNRSGFRVDWVRRLQMHLFALEAVEIFAQDEDPRLSKTGDFNVETVLALGQLQRREGVPIHGRVDPLTYALLQRLLPPLQNPLIGAHLQPDVLVPLDAGEGVRFAYYRRVIKAAGGAFDEAPDVVNILTIRGAELHGTGPFEVRQTPTAREHARIQARLRAGEPLTREALSSPGAQHFWADDESEAAFDDLFITLWREARPGSKTPAERVSEHPGSVDPNLEHESGGRGAAHLSEGQYVYGVYDGQEGHRTTHHMSTIARLEARDDAEVLDVELKPAPRDEAALEDPEYHPRSARYTALRPISMVESRRQDPKKEDGVWDPREQAVNAHLIARRDESRVDGAVDSGGQLREGDPARRKKGDQINHNLHTAHDNAVDADGAPRTHKKRGRVYRDVGVSSAGCMNVHPDDYLALLDEIKNEGSHNGVKRPPPDDREGGRQQQFFTLVDASKISERLEGVHGD